MIESAAVDVGGDRLASHPRWTVADVVRLAMGHATPMRVEDLEDLVAAEMRETELAELEANGARERER